jgi:UDP-N-acetylmuramoyl-L-alanyl-D-glutamate--2,6-diaminopimelate ligase
MIAGKLLDLRVSGRFEAVEMKSKPNSLFVIDYAHNGASLSAVLKAMREYKPTRIICLFGSVGGRTFERRGELARAADADADVIIITSDNPNNEDPMQVINDIHGAITDSNKPIFLIPDRKEAVRKAYELAEDGDFVLLAGKGHETYQLIKGERVPFSERMILEQTDLIMTPVNI